MADGAAYIEGIPARWDDEHDALASRLWREGKSATDVAAALNAVGFKRTRNAVIGRLTRLGVMGGDSRRRPSSPATRAPRPAPPRQKREARMAKPAPPAKAPKTQPWLRVAPEKPPSRVTARALGPLSVILADLPAGACKFPVGEATGADQLFCAEPRAAGDGAYCPACRSRVGGAKVTARDLRSLERLR